MKLTKFQHACLTIEKEGSTLVVDPGAYSHDFIIPKHVSGIIITHDHPDHLDPELVKKIIITHPKAVIISHESVTAAFSSSPTITIEPGKAYTFESFTIEFFGGDHAPIAEGIDVPPNHGVLIDTSLYYPGDSFTIPIDPLSNQPYKVGTLALPVSAPWLTFAQVRDFLGAVKPSLVFPTHDGILSEDGKALAERMVGGFASSQGIVYKRLDGKSINLP